MDIKRIKQVALILDIPVFELIKMSENCIANLLANKGAK